jgi:hypothetical protein
MSVFLLFFPTERILYSQFLASLVSFFSFFPMFGVFWGVGSIRLNNNYYYYCTFNDYQYYYSNVMK